MIPLLEVFDELAWIGAGLVKSLGLLNPIPEDSGVIVMEPVIERIDVTTMHDPEPRFIEQPHFTWIHPA